MRCALAPVVATVLVMTASAMAGSSDITMYAINHQGQFPNFGDTVIRFSPDDTLNYETLGPTGINVGMGGLELDGDGNLWSYATFNSFGGAASGLYRINMRTGAATVQGTLSTQTLNDLAWNPVTDQMYGVYTQGFATSRLYTVNLVTGAVSLVGAFSGLDAQHNVVGLAFDSDGAAYIYDNMNNKFYVADSSLNLTLLYDTTVTQCEGCELAVGSQGISIDWSRGDVGYHGSAGQGEFPNYYGNLNTFATDGSSYVWGPDFGPVLGTGPQYPPQVQAGDLAIVPAGQAIAGDLDHDGDVDNDDRAQLCTALGTSSGAPGFIDAADFDHNGEVDELDQQAFNDILPPCAGDIVDTNTFQPPSDGMTDGADLAFLLGAWGNGASCADFVGSKTFAPPPDGVVDGADLAVLLGAWGVCD